MITTIKMGNSLNVNNHNSENIFLLCFFFNHPISRKAIKATNMQGLLCVKETEKMSLRIKKWDSRNQMMIDVAFKDCS